MTLIIIIFCLMIGSLFYFIGVITSSEIQFEKAMETIEPLRKEYERLIKKYEDIIEMEQK